MYPLGVNSIVRLFRKTGRLTGLRLYWSEDEAGLQETDTVVHQPNKTIYLYAEASGNITPVKVTGTMDGSSVNINKLNPTDNRYKVGQITLVASNSSKSRLSANIVFHQPERLVSDKLWATARFTALPAITADVSIVILSAADVLWWSDKSDGSTKVNSIPMHREKAYYLFAKNNVTKSSVRVRYDVTAVPGGTIARDWSSGNDAERINEHKRLPRNENVLLHQLPPTHSLENVTRIDTSAEFWSMWIRNMSEIRGAIRIGEPRISISVEQNQKTTDLVWWSSDPEGNNRVTRIYHDQNAYWHERVPDPNRSDSWDVRMGYRITSSVPYAKVDDFNKKAFADTDQGTGWLLTNPDSKLPAIYRANDLSRGATLKLVVTKEGHQQNDVLEHYTGEATLTIVPRSELEFIDIFWIEKDGRRVTGELVAGETYTRKFHDFRSHVLAQQEDLHITVDAVFTDAPQTIVSEYIVKANGYFGEFHNYTSSYYIRDHAFTVPASHVGKTLRFTGNFINAEFGQFTIGQDVEEFRIVSGAPTPDMITDARSGSALNFYYSFTPAMAAAGFKLNFSGRSIPLNTAGTRVLAYSLPDGSSHTVDVWTYPERLVSENISWTITNSSNQIVLSGRTQNVHRYYEITGSPWKDSGKD